MRGLLASIVAMSLCWTAAAGESNAPEQTQFPERARCGLNLVEIGKRLQTCVAEHGGEFPSKLSQVFIDLPTSDWGLLTCPAAAPAVVEGGFYPSYSYVAMTPEARRSSDGGEDIVAFDSAAVHEGGRNVLLSDLATVQYLAEAEFEKRMAEQRARWEARGRKLDVIAQDLMPLRERTGRPFFGSVHFKIVATLLIAIAVVLVLLALQARKRGGTPGAGRGEGADGKP